MDAWFIKDTTLLQRLKEEDLQRVRRICPPHTYQRGSAIFRTGDPATHMHIIVAGQVKLVRVTASGKERIVALCSSDDFIGEAFLPAENAYHVDAIALSEVHTCPVSREQFMRLQTEVPQFALTFTEILVARLLYCREQFINAHEPVRSRIIQALIEQTQRFGKQLEGNWYGIKTDLTHDDFGALIGATRVTVSQTLAELRERGLVEGTRGEYRLNLPALESLVER
jgi:CRP/FNR family cyclic AMP-dependent transcriptional regulator